MGSGEAHNREIIRNSEEISAKFQPKQAHRLARSAGRGARYTQPFGRINVPGVISAYEDEQHLRLVSRARPYSRRVRVWGIWTETRGKKECFNCLRNRVIRSSMWSVPTV